MFEKSGDHRNLAHCVPGCDEVRMRLGMLNKLPVQAHNVVKLFGVVADSLVAWNREKL